MVVSQDSQGNPDPLMNSTPLQIDLQDLIMRILVVVYENSGAVSNNGIRYTDMLDVVAIYRRGLRYSVIAFFSCESWTLLPRFLAIGQVPTCVHENE